MTEEILQLLESKRYAALRRELAEMKPMDLAPVFEELDNEKTHIAFSGSFRRSLRRILLSSLMPICSSSL